MPAHEDDDESRHFKPDAWKVAWEATQDVRSPPCEVKVAAELLARTENLQQAMGWMLLTQVGVLLGSFGPSMTVGVALLSWAIFMLEAILKFARNWAHKRFFMDVPCAYVPIHKTAARRTLVIFERFIQSAVLLEIALFVPYIVVVFQFLVDTKLCVHADHPDCTQGSDVLAYLLLFCITTAFCHAMTSLVTMWTFDSAMGGGKVARIRRRFWRNSASWGSGASRSCSCNEKGCERGRWFRSPRNDSDRVLCLTWWVHMARHRHLSAVVASAQPGNCGLPGHWFEPVSQLKKIVEGVVTAGAGEHVPNSAAPLSVSQEMGLRALVSLSKRDETDISREIVRDNGFDVLVRVLREGKISACRGLAAAVIGILSTQHEAIRSEGVHIAVAVIPLKRLARSKDYDLKEVALGALLNTALNDDQFPEVLAQMHCSEGIVGDPRSTFLSLLMHHAQSGPTPRCQELAIGLLARLAGESTQARTVLMANDGVEKLIALLQHGLTAEMKASAAGVLSELAFKEGRAIGRGPHGQSSILALVNALQSEPRIAYASARAICNLAIKSAENKPIIIGAGGVERFVGLLAKKVEMQHHDDAESLIMQDVQAEAARALWILARNSAENQQFIVKADALDPLVDLLSNPRPKVYMQGVAALSGLAWRNRKNQDLIGQQGSRIFPKMVSLLSDLDDEKMKDKVLEKVAVAFRSFADGNKSNQEMLVRAGALAVLRNICEERERKTMLRVNETPEHNSKAMSRLKEAIECLTESMGESSRDSSDKDRARSSFTWQRSSSSITVPNPGISQSAI